VYRDLALHHERHAPGQAGYYRERANALVPGIAPDTRLEPPPSAQKSAAGDSADPTESARRKYNLAVLNRSMGRLDDAEDLLRGALALARTDAALTAEIRYEFACAEALRGPGHFDRAMACLRDAFRGQAPSIEQRISRDIDEGGPLHALASQPPFDKAVNGLLLDMSVS
jgi:tetratricopeptide (TPR) repeat protein